VLQQYNKKDDGVIYYSRYPNLWQIPNLLAAADFYIHPHSEITNNLMPLLSSQYGAIPILCPDGHSLSDTFTNENALIIENHNLKEQIEKAIELYKDTEALTEKRIRTMESVVPWSTAKEEYIKLYEQ
jgi:glycosyltransferase involved in cell wall biosynthesis